MNSPPKNSLRAKGKQIMNPVTGVRLGRRGFGLWAIGGWVISPTPVLKIINRALKKGAYRIMLFLKPNHLMSKALHPMGCEWNPINLLLIGSVLITLALNTGAAEMKNGDQIAILSGLHLRNYAWSSSGHLKLIVDELKQKGITKFPIINLEQKTTLQMADSLDQEVIAKKPVYALIIPGTSDYNPWREAKMPEATRQNLEEIITKLKKAGIPTSIMTSYAMNCNLSFGPNQHAAGQNAAIRELAQKYDIPLIDFMKMIDKAANSSPVAFDGNPVAQCLVSQLLASRVLSIAGFSDEQISECRKGWMDLPGAITFMPLVSVNTYTALKATAKKSGIDVGEQMARVLTKAADQKTE